MFEILIFGTVKMHIQYIVLNSRKTAPKHNI